jgi:tRNA nucleotidyltransferase (CCA-adding enzyme)
MKRIKKKLTIPDEFFPGIKNICSILKDHGYECYIVGGSVRDLLLGIDVYDFDFATNATPERIMKVFKRVIPTGIKHGTVTVLMQGNAYEVTTYRCDGKYFDGRRPENITYSETLSEDIVRRDFTINGLAYDIDKEEIIDYVDGLVDLEKKVIRTIGNPMDRFYEDGLRPYRACRFAAKINFEITLPTLEAIAKTLDVAKKVSVERIREELVKLLQSDKPSIGLEYMRKTGLMELVLPELYNCYNVEQNKYHMHDIYYHCLYSCDAAPKDSVLIRLAALLHDIGKLPTRKKGSGGDYIFYNHEVIGSRIAKKILKRLKFSNEEIEKIRHLIYNHMFHYTDEWTDGAVRRFMRKVGVENLPDLIALRLADRKGTGAREGIPAPIIELQKRIATIIEQENAITVKDLNINGNVIMQAFHIGPGPLIGQILHELLEIVLDYPEMNQPDILLGKAREFYNQLKKK